MRQPFSILLGLFIVVSLAFSSIDSIVVPENWPEPSYNFAKNPLKQETITLGRLLFYDPVLSADSSISCANCHSPYNAFTHVDHDLSHGIQDRIGTRNSPALMNLAWQDKMMWDGAINHLDMQALAPITHPDEMGSDIASVVKKLNQQQFYKNYFSQAFGDEEVTGERVLKALSQFMLTLVSSNSKYDQVKNGTAQFTAQEANGYLLFKQNCASCHTEPLFSSYQFANNGLPVDPSLKDAGRMRITQQKSDSLLFKIPSLRNVEFSYPYMHDGRFKKLSEVINHYTSGIQQHPTLSSQLKKGILLNANEKVDLIAFLLTLSDRSFLFNNAFTYPSALFNIRKQ